MKNFIKFLGATTGSLIISAPALAQMPERMADDEGGTGFIGVTGVVISEYLGSDDHDLQVLPYLSLDNVKGFDFFGTALTYRAVDIGTGQGLGKWSLRAGPRAAYTPGRDSDDSPTLTGFEDIDGSLPVGAYAFGTVGPVGLRLDAGQDVIGGHGGLTVDASVGTAYVKDRFGIQPGVTLSWADNTHNDAFFGVNDAQSAASGLGPYNPGAGIYGYSAGLVAWYEVKKNYAVVLTGSYRWFTDEAENSPILNAPDGSRNGFFAGLSVARKFDTNKW